MSLFQTEKVSCPKCGHEVEFDVIYSVNADRRTDLRDGILDGSFQRAACPGCEHAFRLAPELSYLDVGRAQWILVCPAGKIEHWQELEAQARATFDRAYGPQAAPLAREIGAGLRVRVVFGWAALREKLLVAELQLDDVSLELLKLAILRTTESLNLDDDVELRLLTQEGDELVLAWIHAASERLVETLRVPRSLYDEVTGDAAAWKAVRDELTSGSYVDMNRLLTEPAAPDVAA